MATTQERLSTVEGRVDEMSAAIQEFRQDLRAIHGRIDQLGTDLNGRIDRFNANLNGRVDRLFIAMLGIGAAQIGLLITLVLRV